MERDCLFAKTSKFPGVLDWSIHEECLEGWRCFYEHYLLVLSLSKCVVRIGDNFLASTWSHPSTPDIFESMCSNNLTLWHSYTCIYTWYIWLTVSHNIIYVANTWNREWISSNLIWIQIFWEVLFLNVRAYISITWNHCGYLSKYSIS